MWPEYLHHVTLHFPIAGGLAMAPLGLLYLRGRPKTLETVLRFGGWALLGLTTVAVISGIVSAPGLLGGDGPLELSHHRNMGILTWCVMVSGVVAMEAGLRSGSQHACGFGALAWSAVALSVLGGGHWGGSVVHSDLIPWDGSPPAIEELERGSDTSAAPQAADPQTTSE